MGPGFRQVNSWLHGWSGLILGWLLYAVFLTGTYSFFRDEITWWMQPELHGSVPDAETPERALAKVAELAPTAALWSVILPSDRMESVRLLWREAGQGEMRGRRMSGRHMDAGTGALLTPRETSGGEFLYHFHFELYAMPRTWGRWIVGIATMAMFVAIVSGVITHKKIFTDFFTFRPGKGQRSWLDAHNVTAVLSLPFHVMITFSGLVLLAGTLMPWGNLAAGVQGRGGQPAAVAAAPAPAAEPASRFAPLAPMLAAAEAAWGQPVGRFVVNNPTASQPVLELAPRYNPSLLEGGGGGATRMRFDARSGTLLEAVGTPERSAARAVAASLNSLHRGRFAEPVLRWVYFLAGVGGTLMVATGLVLWSVKRAAQRRDAPAPFGHRLVAHLNVGAVAGMPVAIAAHFWANRLLPVGLPDRAEWEINIFFLVWLLTFLHPLLRPLKRAWVEQLAAAAALLALLPVLNALTTPFTLIDTLAAGRWLLAGFDLTMLGLAALFAVAAWTMHRHDPTRKAGRAGPAQREDQPAPLAAE
ncbi:PepSY-associated TM helix domain-containing protein [Rhodocista pekingensis]|uniref:PepSY-associated TM helix domain-containing protein n=1 Tax=Rhodocista pekingensis TaxID=201185 RepID=A0ABW2KZ93_9PROT